MEDQDLDDLFADPLNEPLNEEQIQQQLDNVTSVPPPPGLIERVNHLRLTGCSEYIAWSRIGSIAYLSKDRREVFLCNLRFSNEKGDWVTNDHTDYNFPPHLRQVFKGRELAHLSWNPTSLELLVADVCGRIGLFNLAIALNRAVMAKVFTPEQDDSLNALVGMTWLHQKRPVSSCQRSSPAY
jgi:mediator of RNA polymerase II transcription subunit 16, fungi type